jgi:hypothetical protein
MNGTYVGRADLVRMLAADPTGTILESAAALAGYEKPTSPPTSSIVEDSDERSSQEAPERKEEP